MYIQTDVGHVRGLLIIKKSHLSPSSETTPINKLVFFPSILSHFALIEGM